MKSAAEFPQLLAKFFTDRLMQQRQASPHTIPRGDARVLDELPAEPGKPVFPNQCGGALSHDGLA